MRGMRSDFDPSTKIDWAVIKQIWPYLLEYKARIVLALLCLVAAKFASVGMPFILKEVVDDLDKKMAGVDSALIAVPLALLLAYGIARFANALLGEIRDTLFGRVTERAMRRVGFLVFNIVPTFLELFLVMGILWQQYRYEFALIVLVSVISYVWFSKKTTDWRTQFIREANQADSRSNSRAVDSLLNFETVKYFANERYEAALYDQELENWEQAKRKNRLTLFALNAGQALIISASLTAMLLLAASEVAAGRMTLGDFVLVNAFMMQIFLPLNFLGFVYREIKSSMANIERMFELLKTEAKVQDEKHAKELSVSEGKIEFKKVSFAYDEERPILKDFSFSLEPGEKVAIVGSSGAGKSTLAKLVFRFYDVTQGDILIDGQSIKAITQHSLRQAIGVVPQDSVLFNDTLIENVRYGRPDASDEDVKRAIQMAHLQEFVDSLPKAYETQVGERGLKLSGGEKQRVAIARTILKQPAILVFDEATSSLDSRSERSVMNAIEAVSKGKTSIVIAHRLSTVVNSDRILVLEKGQIVEQGSHDRLLALGGHYAQLWAMQQKQ